MIPDSIPLLPNGFVMATAIALLLVSSGLLHICRILVLSFSRFIILNPQSTSTRLGRERDLSPACHLVPVKSSILYSDQSFRLDGLRSTAFRLDWLHIPI